ncbi:MAG: hypothetical protein HFJ36_04530 [Clostridia bacterium]|nr:hypothetical protein [Clostridia bacterium]
MKRNKLEKVGILVLFIIIIFVGLDIKTKKENKQENVIADNQISYKISNIPEYSGDIYVLINNNEPKFFEYDMQIDECYSNLENGRVRNGYDKN